MHPIVRHRAGRRAVLLSPAALLPDVLPGDKFVLGSAIGNISFQPSQILGFVAGAAVVAVVDPYWTLGLNAVSFGISALIITAGVRARPLPDRDQASRPSLWAVSAFVQAFQLATRARAFGLAQSGLYAVQGLGILVGGAVAEAIGAPLAVGLAGLVGLTAAAMLAVNWTQLHGSAAQVQQPEAGSF